jgi:hypothetical protein
MQHELKVAASNPFIKLRTLITKARFRKHKLAPTPETSAFGQHLPDVSWDEDILDKKLNETYRLINGVPAVIYLTIEYIRCYGKNKSFEIIKVWKKKGYLGFRPAVWTFEL